MSGSLNWQNAPIPYIKSLITYVSVWLDEAAAAGFDLLQFCNLNSYRTKFILGFSIYMGLSVPQYFNGYVITTGRGPVQSGSATVSTFIKVINLSFISISIWYNRHFLALKNWIKTYLAFILCAVWPNYASDLHFPRCSGRNYSILLRHHSRAQASLN